MVVPGVARSYLQLPRSLFFRREDNQSRERLEKTVEKLSWAPLDIQYITDRCLLALYTRDIPVDDRSIPRLARARQRGYRRVDTGTDGAVSYRARVKQVQFARIIHESLE